MTKPQVIHAVLDANREAGYLAALVHDTERDAALENMLAFIDLVQSQPGYPNSEEDTNGQSG